MLIWPNPYTFTLSPCPTALTHKLHCSQRDREVKESEPAAWSPARPWNFKCGRHVSHKMFTLTGEHRQRRRMDWVNSSLQTESGSDAKKLRAGKSKVKTKDFFFFLELLLGRKCSYSRPRVLNVAQCWQSHVWVHSVGAPNLVAQHNVVIQTQQRNPSKPIYPPVVHKHPERQQLAQGNAVKCHEESILDRAPGCHSFSGLPAESTLQRIRWPSQCLSNKCMISNTCPSSHTW